LILGLYREDRYVVSSAMRLDLRTKHESRYMYKR
jgi:hypothetical protein